MSQSFGHHPDPVSYPGMTMDQGLICIYTIFTVLLSFYLIYMFDMSKNILSCAYILYFKQKYNNLHAKTSFCRIHVYRKYMLSRNSKVF